MAFTEFYADPVSGDNRNSGSTSSASPAYAATNGAWANGTGVFTPASGDPSASVSVGDYAAVFADGATAAAFVGKVTAVTSTTVTVSLTAASGTNPNNAASGISMRVGGAWLGPSGASAFPFGTSTTGVISGAMVTSGTVTRLNLKNNATYSVTAAISHGTAGPLVIQGYSSSPGDGGRAVIDGGTGGAGYVLFTVASAGVQTVLRDLEFKNNGGSGSSTGVSVGGSRCLIERCVFRDFRGQGLQLAGAHLAVECEAYGCNQNNGAGVLGGFFLSSGSAVAIRCVSHDNAGTNSVGFNVQASCLLLDCIADTNGAEGFTFQATAEAQLIRCVAYNNGGAGAKLNTAASTLALVNCLLVSNAAYGVNNTQATGLVRLTNCAYYNNTSGETTGYVDSSGSITLSGNPFVDAANGDFDLNSTAGAGAACRGAGRGAFLQTASGYTGTLSVPDVGASQHADAGGGSTGGVSRGRLVNAGG